MSEPLVVTFGCRLNALEAEMIRGSAAAAGAGDAIVVNTCAVTKEAVRQAGQSIRRLRREHPGRRLIVTGCAAQLEPQRFAAMPEVDQVLGNREKRQSDAYRANAPRLAVAAPEPALAGAPITADGRRGRARAYVEIQHGCDHRCTFCIIPFARGANRSRPAEEVIDQVRRTRAAGFREIVLTGVDICSWGRDADGPGLPLGRLVARILDAVPELERLRLSSLDPAAIDDELCAAYADQPRLMPHLHLSLQAGSDLILKRMRRRHRVGPTLDLVARLRAARPEMLFGADLIAGFPTEDEALFSETEATVEAMGLTYLHVFPYSARPGTPAARMPPVAAGAIRERAARLRALGLRLRRHHFAGRIGEDTRVVVETPRLGRCPAYAPVRLDRDAQPGAIVAVRIVAADTDALDGRVLE